MILKKANKKSKSKNAMMQPLEIDGLCCGDKKCALLRKYAAVIDLASKTTAQSITLGGVNYPFGCVIDLTSPKGLDQLKSAIEDALTEAGYGTDGVTFKKDGDTLTITTHWSQVSFDDLNADAACVFNVVDAMAYGDLLNCDCCDADAVCTVVPPTCYAADAVASADAATVAVVGESGKILASWVSATEGDVAVFDAGGAAAVALTAAGLDWSFDGEKLKICDPSCPLGTITQTVGDDAATELGAFEMSGDVLVCFKVVACNAVSNVVINDGTNDVYSGPLSTPGECEVFENVTITDNVICLNATALSYTEEVTFTITISQEGCDDVVTTKTVNF